MKLSSALALALALVTSLTGSLVACGKTADPAPASPTTPAASTTTVAAPQGATPAAAPKVAIGSEAPDFSLRDLDNNEVKLSSFRGKIVVLEWFNPECPFVKLAHEKRKLGAQAAREKKAGVVWLAVNSGAPGKQGAGKEASAAGKARFGIDYPVLLDESGAVGKSYGAARTPHMFVIDAQGKLAYAGALDDTKGGDVDGGEKVVNHVEAALTAVREGKPAPTPSTAPWGCGVKYGS